MTQLEVIPLRAVQYLPIAARRTAHVIGRAMGEDGKYYFVKTGLDVELICATEWVCNSIADSLNLPVPSPKVLQTPDDILIYGTQEISPRLPEIESTRILYGQAGNSVFIPELANLLSSTYALDLVIGNLDRHQDNFVISIDGLGGPSQQVGHLHLIDFGSADFLQPTKGSLPLPQMSNTVHAGRQIRRAHGFANSAASTLLSRFKDGRKFLLERAFFGMPGEWLSKKQRESFANWIGSAQFENRLSLIGEGLSDGTYL
jgi:hypothetical protein